MTQTPEFTTVSPYLFYPDGDAAAAWLIRVLGFGPARSIRGPGGDWAEGEVATNRHVRTSLTCVPPRSLDFPPYRPNSGSFHSRKAGREEQMESRDQGASAPDGR